jgi:predicted phosphodiesterase
MILGIYADLHANYPAILAMEKALGRIDRWIALGDSVGLYPFVNEVLDWQRKNNVLCLRGDHEQALVTGTDIQGSFTGSESIKRQAKIISNENLNFVKKLPEAHELLVDDLRICISHFIDLDMKNKSQKYTFDLSILEEKYSKFDYVFFGHTHLPAVLYGKNTIFINPGSAGFPIDVERRCSAIIFNTETRRFELVRYDYEEEVLICEIEVAGYNERLVSYIRNGHRWG